MPEMQLPPDAPQAVQSTAAVHRAAARSPSMAWERLCLCARRTALGGAHERGRRVSRVMSYLRTSPIGLRCPMMRRHYDARRCFELTGQVTPIHIPALVDLVGRVAGAPPEYRRAPSPRRPCRGPGATCHRGAREAATGGGHRASGVTPPRLPVGGAKFVRAHPRVSHGFPRVGAVDRVAALARECTVRGSANADDASRPPPAQ